MVDSDCLAWGSGQCLRQNTACTEIYLEQAGDLRVPVRHVRHGSWWAVSRCGGCSTESADDVAQSEQTLIDVHCLLYHSSPASDLWNEPH